MTRTVAIGVFVAVAASAAGAAAQAPAHTVVPAAAAVTAPALPVEAAGGKAPAIPAAPVSQGYTYTAEGRRDPFVTLIRRGADTSATTVEARAAGLAGLAAGEVTLRGIMASQGAYVAMLFGADDKTYIVRAGDKLADGTVRDITADAMVIDQQFRDPQDPLARRQTREVRKMLRQTEGTN